MTEADDMAQHLNQFRELANQLRGLSADAKGMDDGELFTILTLSLPESYERLVMALQSRTYTITFDIMAGRLLQESGRRHISQISQTNQGSNWIPQTAFTEERSPGFGRGGRASGGNWHTYNGRGRGGSLIRLQEPLSTSQPQSEALLGRSGSLHSNHVPPGTKFYYCGKGAQWPKDCYKPKSDEVGGEGTGSGRAKEFTFLVESQVLVGTGWIIDSGASQHLSREQTRFITYRTVSTEQAITIADGTRINAHGIGDIEIATTAGVIHLTEVWHVPTIEASLMSIAGIGDAGYVVGFEATRCYMSKAGRKIEIGLRKGSLYHLIQDERIPSV